MAPARVTAIALVLIALVAGTASPLAAHARLERSVPAAGDTLRTPLAELRLAFSEPVEPGYISLTLISPTGDVIHLEPLRPDPATRGREFFVASPALIRPGQYRVEWRAMSADGHLVNGAFTFTALTGALVRTPVASQERVGDTQLVDPAQRVPAEALPPYLRQQSWLSIAARLVHFAAILALIGTAAFRTLLLPGAGMMPTVQFRLAHAARRFGIVAVSLLLITLPLRLWLQAAAMVGPDRVLDPAFLAALLTGVTWGQAWLAQAALVLVAGFAVVSGFVPLLALAAIALAFTPAFQGHAGTMAHFHTLGIAADGIHVLAAGAWIGSLMVILTAALPVLFHHGPERGGHDTARLMARFSPLAIASVAFLSAAGLTASLLRFHDPRELLTTAYGRTLLLKLGLVLLVLAAGWYNWRRARPALPLHTGVRKLRRAATFELLFALAALAVTASLVALPTP